MDKRPIGLALWAFECESLCFAGVGTRRLQAPNAKGPIAMEPNHTITCEIDLKSGTAKIVAPPEHFSSAAKAVEGIMALRDPIVAQEVRSSGTGTSSSADPEGTSHLGSSAPKPRPENARRANRAAMGSSGRTGRIGSFEPVDFGLAELQERELYNFYQSKAPKTQSEQVATAMYKGEQLLNRKAFKYNDIYSLLRLAGEKHLPKALDVLTAEMTKRNWIARETDDSFVLKFLARDHVEQLLPGSAEKH